MSDWRVVESEVEYETGWYTGGYDLVEQPDGSTKRYYWAQLPPAVVVVAHLSPAVAGVEEPSLVFVEQYRPTVRETHLELPAGIVEDGESFVEAGRRELREETGFAAGDVTLLQDYAVATGVLRHERGVVYAEDLDTVEPDLDDNEFLTVRMVPVAQALERAREPPTNDATIEGLLLAEADGHI